MHFRHSDQQNSSGEDPDPRVGFATSVLAGSGSTRHGLPPKPKILATPLLHWSKGLNVKSFPSHKTHRAVLICVCLTRHRFTLQYHRYGASASRGVPAYSTAIADTHCAYPRRDGQAELTWVAGYIPRYFTCPPTVTHPCK